MKRAEQQLHSNLPHLNKLIIKSNQIIHTESPNIYFQILQIKTEMIGNKSAIINYWSRVSQHAGRGPAGTRSDLFKMTPVCLMKL